MFSDPPNAGFQLETSCLSTGELRVFWFIGEGLKTKQIAAQLHVSIKTVETHRENIKRKLVLDGLEKVICAAALWRSRIGPTPPTWG